MLDLNKARKYYGRAIYSQIIGPRLPRLGQGATTMFHIGRSGSSVLGDLLRQHPRIYWDGEVYRKYLQRLGVEESTFEASQLAGVPPLDPEALTHQAGPLIYGQELKFFHLDLFGQSLGPFVRAIGDLDHQVIVLERKNYLAKIVSSIRAHDTGQYHRTYGAPSQPRAVIVPRTLKIDFATTDLVTQLDLYSNRFADLRHELEAQSIPTLEITYEEDIRKNPLDAYRRCTEFLGLRDRPAKIRLRPQSMRRGLEISNRKEVMDWLAGTPYEWMIDDE